MPEPSPLDTPKDARAHVRYSMVGLALMLGLVVAFPIYRAGEPERREAAEKAMRREYLALGEELYARHCSSCHGEKGEGRPGIPTLATETILEDTSKRQLHWIIAGGLPGTAMSSYHLDYGGPLTDQDIEQVVTYLRSWDVPEEESEAAAPGPDDAPGPEKRAEGAGDIETPAQEEAQTATAAEDVATSTATGPESKPSGVAEVSPERDSEVGARSATVARDVATAMVARDAATATRAAPDSTRAAPDSTTAALGSTTATGAALGSTTATGAVLGSTAAAPLPTPTATTSSEPPERQPTNDAGPGGLDAEDRQLARTTYKTFCAACHGPNGQGTPAGAAIRPPAASTGRDPRDLAQVIRGGRSGTAMKAFAKDHGGPLEERKIWALARWLLEPPAEK